MNDIYSNNNNHVLSFMEHNTNKISSYAYIQLKLFLITILFWSIIFILSTYRYNLTTSIDSFIQNTIENLFILKFNRLLRPYRTASLINTLIILMDMPRRLSVLFLISIPISLSKIILNFKETTFKIKRLIYSIKHFQAISLGHIGRLLYLPIHISLMADNFRKEMMAFQRKAEQLIQIVILPIEALVVVHKLMVSVLNLLNRINPPRARLI